MAEILDAHALSEDVRFLYRQLEQADVWLSSAELWAIVDPLNEAARHSASCALQWYLADQAEPGEASDGLRFAAGIAAMDAGQLDLSRALIEPMIDRSERSEHHSLYAHLLLQMGEPERALVAAERAVALDPEFDEAWFRVGEARRALHHLAEALAAFERAYRLDPSRELNLIEYAGAVVMLHVQGGECAEFERVQSLLAAIAARNDNFWAMIYWAQFQWLADEQAEAERALRVAMLLAPSDRLPYALLATYLLDWRRPRAALDPLLAALRERAAELQAIDARSSAALLQAAADIDRYRETRPA